MAATVSASVPTPDPKNQRRKTPPPPVTISTTRSLADPVRVRDLLAAANLSCHRFPSLDADGRAEPADPAKLRTALAHSSVLVSVHCRARFLPPGEEDRGFRLGELFERVADREMVGFGRAVSDGGLTASIHDVAVIPALRRMGIGRKIIERIIRVLTSRGIYDISALCSEEERYVAEGLVGLYDLASELKIVNAGNINRVIEKLGARDIGYIFIRLFFKACGFGGDTLGATTMMYTQTVPGHLQDCVMVRPAGRMLLMVPPVGQPCISNRIPDGADNLSEAPEQHSLFENGMQD